MNMRKTVFMAISALGLVAPSMLGCGAAQPPKELVDARTAYQRASEGDAKQLSPAELDTARQALTEAESSFEQEPDSAQTKDLAYIADRKAQLAESAAAITKAERDRAAAESEYKNYSAEELAKARDAVQSGQQKLAQSQEQLEAEKKAREEAERIANAALKSLQEIASVKEEKRGVVITLSGAVLFASGKSELLPIAKEKLRTVAKTLKDQGSPPVRIEGHTDSTGSATENRKLSLDRADSVKSYLVSEGLPAAKITTVGKGPDVPVAENSSPEGRANNRRVELIVNPTDGG
jgi:outer membrane protein OmpA-like peptidoglycan-associated protein